MKMPKYKPTKWKIKFCADCNCPIDKYGYHCVKNHLVVERENIPFFVPDMEIENLWAKGWYKLASKAAGGSYFISPSNLETIILKYGIEPGGKLSNRWWMYCKIGSFYSLRQVVDE